MIELQIPDFRDLRLEYLLLDFNGTLAEDGKLLPGVAERLRHLSELLEIHMLSSDIFGTAAEQLSSLPVKLTVLERDAQAKAKRFFALRLGAEKVVAIGNGRNDQQMLAAAGIGIGVIQREGASGATIASADVVVTDVLHALDLLRHSGRLIATLRG